jgi:hypothetical protein
MATPPPAPRPLPQLDAAAPTMVHNKLSEPSLNDLQYILGRWSEKWVGGFVGWWVCVVGGFVLLVGLCLMVRRVMAVPYCM